MEKVAEFNDNNGFKVTLTTDKIYISAIGAEETFALRSVSGVGLYDNIQDYSQKVEAAKQRKKMLWILGLASLVFFPLIIVFGIYAFRSANHKPVLESFFTLMLSGGDRRFPFNKSGNNAKQIAEFINKVEDTLTAYHKG
jgi:hypothetical protein